MQYQYLMFQLLCDFLQLSLTQYHLSILVHWHRQGMILVNPMCVAQPVSYCLVCIKHPGDFSCGGGAAFAGTLIKSVIMTCMQGFKELQVALKPYAKCHCRRVREPNQPWLIHGVADGKACSSKICCTPLWIHTRGELAGFLLMPSLGSLWWRGTLMMSMWYRAQIFSEMVLLYQEGEMLAGKGGDAEPFLWLKRISDFRVVNQAPFTSITFSLQW